MNDQEYYHRVFPKLRNCFQNASYVLGYGNELIKLGWNPSGLLVTVEPVDQLWRLTTDLGLQVYLPLIGSRSNTVMAPLDFEISLTSENYKLYEDRNYQRHFFEKVFILIKYLEKLFDSHGLHYLLDLTPSGGHILFQVRRGTRAFNALKSVGYLEEDLKQAYAYKKHDDPQRCQGVDEDSGLVYSGLGRLSEYIGLKASRDLGDCAGFPITLCDSLDRSINYDNSWAGDAVYKRIMRSPFSLHKKNTQKYGKWWQSSLVDVIQTVHSDQENIAVTDIGYLVDCMWNLDKAADHSQQFSGFIPTANDNLEQLVTAYRNSELFEFHKVYDMSVEYPQDEIKNHLLANQMVSDEIRNILAYPDPALLQPKRIKSFIRELIMEHNYKPKEVGCVLRDFYRDKKYYWAGTDWLKYPAVTRAHFWARTYSAALYVENNRIKI